MVPKRAVIASVILIAIGVFFVFGPEASVTGAVLGVADVVDHASNILAGLLFLWLAGIILIGAEKKKLEEKVIDLETIEKREKKIDTYLQNRDYVFMKSTVSAVDKTGKKPSEITSGEERYDIADKVIEDVGVHYLNFLGLDKSGNEFGKAAVRNMAREDAKVGEEDYNNLSSLTSEGIARSSARQTQNLAARLRGYGMNELYHGPLKQREKNFKSVANKLADYFGVDANKIKTIEDIQKLRNAKYKRQSLEQEIKQYQPSKKAA